MCYWAAEAQNGASHSQAPGGPETWTTPSGWHQSRSREPRLGTWSHARRLSWAAGRKGPPRPRLSSQREHWATRSPHLLWGCCAVQLSLSSALLVTYTPNEIQGHRCQIQGWRKMTGKDTLWRKKSVLENTGQETHSVNQQALPGSLSYSRGQVRACEGLKESAKQQKKTPKESSNRYDYVIAQNRNL